MTKRCKTMTRPLLVYVGCMFCLIWPTSQIGSRCDGTSGSPVLSPHPHVIEVVCHCLSSLFLLKGNFGISSCGRSPHMHYVVCYAYHYVYPIVSLLWYIMVYFIPIFTTHIYIYILGIFLVKSPFLLAKSPLYCMLPAKKWMVTPWNHASCYR